LGGKIKYYNDYDVKGQITTLTITRSTGEKVKVLIDTEDLNRVLKYNWCAGWRKDKNRYYIQVTDYYYDKNGKYKSRTILLHKYIMETYGMYSQVDHKDHDSLNNLKINLRVVEAGNNSSNRKGANSNNITTGVRNVTYIKNQDIYMVQIMKDYKRYKWEFPSSQLKEACEFAEKKRKELFGEYAGEGKNDII
jgi:hypothetical protein